MGQLVVITFDDEAQAGQALRSLRALEKQGLLKLNDTAVVAKDQSGQVRTQNEVSSATEIGAVAGAVVGGLLSFMFPPAGRGPRRGRRRRHRSVAGRGGGLELRAGSAGGSTAGQFGPVRRRP